MFSTCSLLLSLGRRGFGFFSFYFRHGAVLLEKSFVGHTADVGFCDFFNLFDLAEEFAPVAILGLIFAQLNGQALVIAQPADQVGFSAGLDRLQFVIGYILRFQLLDLLMNRPGHLFSRVSLRWSRKKEEQAGILAA